MNITIFSAWKRSFRWLIGLVVVAGIAATSARAAEKRFHVTVKDDTGMALEDIVVGVRAKGEGNAAVTDGIGTATVSLDISDDSALAVVWVSAHSLLDAPEDEKSRLRRRALRLAQLRPIEQLVRVTGTVHDYNVELRYRGIREYHAIVTEQGGPPSQEWNTSPPMTYWGGIIRVDGTSHMPGPTDSDVLFEVYGDSETALAPGRSMIFRVPASSIGPDGDLGTIDINPTIGPTGSVRFNLTAGSEAYRQVSAVFESSDWGITLVKSDGRTVMSFFADSDLHIANDPAVMPVGTWYVVPGSYFCWTWTQRRIIEACLDGVDLSTSGIPSITVTEGANMEVNIDPVAAELAIQAYFTPPE